MTKIFLPMSGLVAHWTDAFWRRDNNEGHSCAGLQNIWTTRYFLRWDKLQEIPQRE
jgi:hypothetical protein